MLVEGCKLQVFQTRSKLACNVRPVQPMPAPEAPSSKHQAPEKPQIPSSKAAAMAARSVARAEQYPSIRSVLRGFGTWSLVFLWSLAPKAFTVGELGIWSFLAPGCVG